ncbi:MAG: pilus assembly protein [Chloroflexi bacterium]|nr:pilus assembly protein [Chloroflexota bacterium]
MEFALIAPILFLLLFGIIQIGLVMAAQNGLVDAARDAARRAATYRINADSFSLTVFPSICDSIKKTFDDHLRPSIPGYSNANRTRTITYEWQQDPIAGQYFLVAHVVGTYKNPLYVPLVSQFLDGTDGTNDGKLELRASEQMRVENPILATPTSTAPQVCTGT